MQPFLHRRLDVVDRLLQSSTTVLRAHAAQDLDSLDKARAHLDDVGEGLHSLGLEDAENEIAAMTAQLVLARRGWNPLTLEQTHSHRRELERAVALRFLVQCGERLRAVHAETRTRLADARDLLAPIVLYGVQKGLLTPDPERLLSQDELGRAWTALQEDGEMQAASRQVALAVAPVDAMLLVGDLLAALR